MTRSVRRSRAKWHVASNGWTPPERPEARRARARAGAARMDFLKRVLRRRDSSWWPPPGPITDWPVGRSHFVLHTRGAKFDPASKVVDVAGESQFQESIER